VEGDRAGNVQLVVAVVVRERRRAKRLRRQQLGQSVGHATRRVIEGLALDAGTERLQ